MGDDASHREKGRRTPSYSLDEALGFASAIQKSLGDGPVGRDAIAEALGHRGVTGALTTKIGTLTHFALLDREGGVYRISKIAKSIIFPLSEEQRRVAITEAAIAPNVYGELWRDFRDKSLPTLLPNILIQKYGIGSSSAGETAETFRKTMEFAGLLRNGVLQSPSNHGADGVADRNGSSDGNGDGRRREVDDAKDEIDVQVRTKEKPRVLADDAEEYRIPLTGRRSAILILPLPLADSDVNRITAWLQLMKDVLSAEPSGD